MELMINKNMRQDNKIKSERKCFYKDGKKWHFFEHNAEKEGELCNCKEMIIKNGTVEKY